MMSNRLSSLAETLGSSTVQQFATAEEAQVVEKRKIGAVEYALVQKYLEYATLKEEKDRVQ